MRTSAPLLAASTAVFNLNKSETFGFFLQRCTQPLSNAKSDLNCLEIHPNSPAPELRILCSSSVKSASGCARLFFADCDFAHGQSVVSHANINVSSTNVTMLIFLL